MIIHFVAQSFEYTTICSTPTRMDWSDETHDPLTGIANFHALFDRIEGRDDRVKPLHLDSSNIRKAFWDRNDFIVMLREQCRDDIYVQSSDYYSMAIGFLNAGDYSRVEAAMRIPRMCYETTYPLDQVGEIKAFLASNGVHKNDYVEVKNDAAGPQIFQFREREIRDLVDISFKQARIGEYWKAPPPIPDHFVKAVA